MRAGRDAKSRRMRRTKVVCTIGPASSSVEQLDRLAAAGMDVARLNFSHGTHAEHAEVVRRIRDGEARWGRPVAILQDLQGPKIRLGTFGEGGGRRVDLEPGRPFALCRRPCVGTVERAFVAPPESLQEVKVGDQVMMDNSLIQLRLVVGGQDLSRRELLQPQRGLQVFDNDAAQRSVSGEEVLISARDPVPRLIQIARSALKQKFLSQSGPFFRTGALKGERFNLAHPHVHARDDLVINLPFESAQICERRVQPGDRKLQAAEGHFLRV